ncbi:MAG: hypothetical protein FWE53_01965 [Firmicutes bacterium]|nr:hypothetical protein [Bacillota bacterium]
MDTKQVNYKKIADKIINELISSKVKHWHTDDRKEMDRFRYISLADFSKKYKDEWFAFNNQTTELQFEAAMRRTFALLKDAHTYFGRASIGEEILDCKFVAFDNEIYVFSNNDRKDYVKVEKINGFPINKITDELEKLISYEVEPWRIASTNLILGRAKTYKLINMANETGDSIIVEGLNKANETTKIQVGIRNSNAKAQANNNYKPYEFHFSEGGKLYVGYHKCQSYEDYPFEEFVENIKAAVGNQVLKGVILDVRQNGGGNSEVIKPLITYLKSYKLNSENTVVLGGNNTYSAGIWAVASFKDSFGATLIGESLGQPAEKYGDTSMTHETEGFTYKMSEKFFDLSKSFGTGGIINPDIVVKRTLEDYVNFHDKQLQTAHDYIGGKKQMAPRGE